MQINCRLFIIPFYIFFSSLFFISPVSSILFSIYPFLTPILFYPLCMPFSISSFYFSSYSIFSVVILNYLQYLSIYILSSFNIYISVDQILYSFIIYLNIFPLFFYCIIYYSCLLTPLFFYPLSFLVPLFSCFHPLILSFINPSVQLLLLLVTSEWSDPKDWFQPPPSTPPPPPPPLTPPLLNHFGITNQK